MFPFIKIDNITYETKMDQNKFRYNLFGTIFPVIYISIRPSLFMSPTETPAPL